MDSRGPTAYIRARRGMKLGYNDPNQRCAPHVCRKKNKTMPRLHVAIILCDIECTHFGSSTNPLKPGITKTFADAWYLGERKQEGRTRRGSLLTTRKVPPNPMNNKQIWCLCGVRASVRPIILITPPKWSINACKLLHTANQNVSYFNSHVIDGMAIDRLAAYSLVHGAARELRDLCAAAWPIPSGNYLRDISSESFHSLFRRSLIGFCRPFGPKSSHHDTKPWILAQLWLWNGRKYGQKSFWKYAMSNRPCWHDKISKEYSGIPILCICAGLPTPDHGLQRSQQAHKRHGKMIATAFSSRMPHSVNVGDVTLFTIHTQAMTERNGCEDAKANRTRRRLNSSVLSTRFFFTRLVFVVVAFRRKMESHDRH